jgi:hypothetical protein
VADVAKNCTNCGNAQAAGAFCERCGARLPDLTTEPASAAAVPAGAPPAAQAPAYQVQPPQANYPQGAYAPAATPPYPYVGQPQYSAPREPGPFGKLFDFSFQGFVTRGSLRLLFGATLVLLGAYFLFAFIFGVVAAVKLGGYWCIGIFSSLFLVAVMIIWTRIMMELTMTVSKIREDADKAAEAKAAESKVAEAKPVKTKS